MPLVALGRHRAETTPVVIAADVTKWTKVAAAAGIKIE